MSMEKIVTSWESLKGTCSSKEKDVPRDLEIVDQMIWYLGN